MSKLEIAANSVNAGSILLACANSVHTWWTGIVGCVLFGWLFFTSQLYADVTLQVFFVATSIVGWRNWAARRDGATLPVRRTPPRALLAMLAAAVGGALAYGWILHEFTDAFAPFVDSVVLTFSILGQLLLIRRRYEAWWCWLLVNSVAVPLYLSRGLSVTALLYAVFWITAVVALIRWRRLIEPS